MDINDQEKLFHLIKRSLWNTGTVDAVDGPVFEEMKKQALAALPAGILSRLDMPDDLRTAWQAAVYQQIAYNVNYRRAQAELPLAVPYAILKGVTAAQYYPHPEYRAMGDIDIITRREDYQATCASLLAAGYAESPDHDNGRHRAFLKNGITVEVHAYFASLNDPRQAQYLDDLIIESITPSHVLPDPVNGLVLLEHISQHLENGLGLRQIIDWMMFVHQCLPDQEWPSFRQMANQIGLETLAVTVTRMCEMYLGLPERQWCKGANYKVCDQLMEFILSSGNFGIKLTSDADVGETILTYSWGPVAALKYLQERGLENWKITRRVAFLRPFAWLYQAGRYLFKGFCQDEALKTLRKQYSGAKKRKRLLDALAVKQKSKGLVVYKNGKYIKE